MAGESVGELWVDIRARMDGLSKDLNKARSNVQAWGDKMSSAGRALTMGVTAPLLAMGAAAVKASLDFNKGMANVATLIPGNVARVGELKKAVQDLAIGVGASTSDLTGGLYQVISAFGDTADSVKILEVNARAARAGLATTTDAINLTSAVTKAYGDTSAAAVLHASDLALMTVRLGQTTFPELAASIGRVTPLAQALGVSQQELFGVIATGSGVTGSAAEVNTQFRMTLAALASPSKDMTKLYAQMGVTSGKAAIEQFGLQGTIQRVVDAAKAAGVPLQKYIESVEAQTLALTLAGPQAANLTEKIGAMNGVLGTTGAAFDAATIGINAQGFAYDRLKQLAVVALQQIGDAVGTALDPATVKSLTASLTELIRTFAALPPETKKLIIEAAAIVIALGPVLTVVGQVVTALGALNGAAVTAAGSAGLLAGGGGLLALVAPLGIVAGLFTALGAVILAVLDPTRSLKEGLDKLLARKADETYELVAAVDALKVSIGNVRIADDLRHLEDTIRNSGAASKETAAAVDKLKADTVNASAVQKAAVQGVIDKYGKLQVTIRDAARAQDLINHVNFRPAISQWQILKDNVSNFLSMVRQIPRTISIRTVFTSAPRSDVEQGMKSYYGKGGVGPTGVLGFPEELRKALGLKYLPEPADLQAVNAAINGIGKSLGWGSEKNKEWQAQWQALQPVLASARDGFRATYLEAQGLKSGLEQQIETLLLWVPAGSKFSNALHALLADQIRARLAAEKLAETNRLLAEGQEAAGRAQAELSAMIEGAIPGYEATARSLDALAATMKDPKAAQQLRELGEAFRFWGPALEQRTKDTAAYENAQKSLTDSMKELEAAGQPVIAQSERHARDLEALAQAVPALAVRLLAAAAQWRTYGGAIEVAAKATSQFTALGGQVDSLLEGIATKGMTQAEQLLRKAQAMGEPGSGLSEEDQAKLDAYIATLQHLVGVETHLAAMEEKRAAQLRTKADALAAATAATTAATAAENLRRTAMQQLGMTQALAQEDLQNLIHSLLEAAYTATPALGRELVKLATQLATVGVKVQEHATPALRSLSDLAAAVFTGMKITAQDAVGAILNSLDKLGVKSDSIWGRLLKGVGSFFAAGGGPFGWISGIGSLFGLAEGGTITSSGLALVGERGPEVLSLPRGAQVTPLPAATSAGAGVSQTIIIQLDGRTLARATAENLPKELYLRGVGK